MFVKFVRVNRVLLAMGVFMALLDGGAGTVMAEDGGVLGCNGNSVHLSGGTAGNDAFTNFRFNNFNDTATIAVDRMIVYDNDGDVLCDFPSVNAFPPSLKAVLGPHESASVTTLSMPCVPPPSFPGGGLQAIISWSFEAEGDKIPLRVISTTSVIDSVTYTHIARDSTECMELKQK